MKRHIRLAVLTVTASLVVAGCAQQTAGVAQPAGGATSGSAATTTPATPSTANKDADAVQFSEQVCGAVLKFVDPAVQMASFKPDTSSPAAAVKSVKGVLGKLSAGLGASLTDLEKIDASAVEGGDRLVGVFTDAFGQLKQKIDDSIARLDAVNPNDARAVSSAMQKVGTDLQDVGKAMSALDQLGDTSPELDAAARKAPTCVRISQLGSTLTG